MKVSYCIYKGLIPMKKKSWLNNFATFFGLFCFVIISLGVVRNYPTIDAMNIKLVFITLIVLLFPLLRSYIVNALGYAIVFWFTMRWLVGTDTLPQFTLTYFIPLAVFFFCGMIEAEGIFLRGLVLSWWGIVLYHIYELNQYSTNIVPYIGEIHFNYAINHWEYILISAIIFKVLVKLTMRDIPYYAPVHLNDEEYIAKKSERKRVRTLRADNYLLELENKSPSYEHAHPFVKELYDRGVITDDNIVFYAHLTGKELFDELYKHNHITEIDIPLKYREENSQQSEDQMYSSEIVNNREESNDRDEVAAACMCEEINCKCCKCCSREKTNCLCCSTCQKYPCSCCAECSQLPCSCCPICGLPSKWCNCIVS
jgi:hypothetical protein